MTEPLLLEPWPLMLAVIVVLWAIALRVPQHAYVWLSQHHRKQHWTTHSPKLRRQLEPQLPLRCVNCSHLVTPDMQWQVGHRVDAARGGTPTIDNVGPVHAYCPWCKRRCNQVAGGKLGASVTNAKRAAASNEAKGIRAW